VVKQSAEEIVDAIQGLPEGSRILVLSPVVRARKGTYQAVFEEIRKAGFARARVDGTVYNLDEEISLDRYKIHTIESVVDRLVISHAGSEVEQTANLTRLTDSVETALKFGDGYLTIQILAEKAENNQDQHFSEHLACPEHGISIPEIEPPTARVWEKSLRSIPTGWWIAKSHWRTAPSWQWNGPTQRMRAVTTGRF
jgi:excinuclease ABC subunit A